MTIRLMMAAALSAVLSATTLAGHSDEWLSVSDDTAVVRTYGTRHVCVFTNTSAAATVTLKKGMTLDEYLVVGGGGAGGNNIAGGGGGGGVVHADEPQALSAGAELVVSVGAGGATSAVKNGSGSQGGHSTLAFGGRTVSGFGGNGGASFTDAVPAAPEEGQVGSGGGATGGKSIGTDGWQWNSEQGNAGVSRSSFDIGGGGGGAGSAATYDYGGEGLSFTISGKRVVYGSGGGGGVLAAAGIGGKGGTNAGRGGVSAAYPATAGVDGTGGGGGGGGVLGPYATSAQRGGAGGSGTVILVLSEAAADVSRFVVQPIEDQLYVSSAVCQAVTVTNGAGEVPTDDYTVSYVGNDGAGDAVAVVQGAAGTAYAGYTAICPFRIRAVAYEDENILASDAGVSNVVVEGRQIYIFTNADEKAVFRMKRLFTLDGMLLVGGGGSGGGPFGGGGGGGGYVVSNDFVLAAAGSEGVVQVGAGATAYPVSKNDVVVGRQGGHSWFDFGDVRVTAFGGGGGGWNNNSIPPTPAVYGEIGSSGGADLVGTEGLHWNPAQGHCGGSRYADGSSGGGGGAGLPGLTKGGLGVLGGEGVTNAITGAPVVYGSGGGGHPLSGLSGAGGTNAGDGYFNACGGNGVDGTGGGGGGGGNNDVDTGSPGAGGSGIVVLSFVPGDRVHGRFEIAPIPDQVYTGRPVRPAPVVVNVDGETLAAGVDYVTAYSNCDGVGTGSVTVSGQTGTIYEGYSTRASYVIRAPEYADDMIYTSDPTVRRIVRGKRSVYVFTNAASAATVRFLKNIRLRQALVVGGGGSGGTVAGGGGGGGGVAFTNRLNLAFARDAELTLEVGAGALPTKPAASGNERYPAGKQGGQSSLSAQGLSLVAYGGGGGGGFVFGPTAAAETGKIGSGGGATNNQSPGEEGTQWQQGNKGGTGNTNCGGGGGGMFSAGGTYVGFAGGHGGEGLTNAITGVEVVYGSGGGGGTRSTASGVTCTPGEGGTNAGNGNNRGVGCPGVDGTGGGGGGGALNGSVNCEGGAGGSGTVIIEVSPVEGLKLIAW